MLRDVVSLDAHVMTSEALQRLAKHGFWTSREAPAARARAEAYAEKVREIARSTPLLAYAGGEDAWRADRKVDATELSPAEAAVLLERSFEDVWVVIRRQLGVVVFWYARPVEEVLRKLQAFSGDASVEDALNLHEYTSDKTRQKTSQVEAAEQSHPSIVLDGLNPIAVDDEPGQATTEKINGTLRGPVFIDRARKRSSIDLPTAPQRAGDEATATGPDPEETELEAELEEEGPAQVHAFPYVDAPSTVVMQAPFDLTVGLARTAQPDVMTPGEIVLDVPPGAKSIPIEVSILADGFKCENGWTQNLDVEVANPTAARVTFRLTALPQSEPVRLTSIVVQFLADAVVRGSATRNIVVEKVAGQSGRADDRGTPWIGGAPPPRQMDLIAPADAADIELDIAKLNGQSDGRFSCVIRNAHGIPAPLDPLTIDLGDDARTFAKGLIDDMYQWAGDGLVGNLLKANATIVARKLPSEFWQILSAVAPHVKGRPIRLQLNSSDPYVPWELAFVESPVDPTRPGFLAAQVSMSRWVLGDSAIPTPPKSGVGVKALAVMAGMYNLGSNLTPLPKAAEEAQELVDAYATQLKVIPLVCSPAEMKSLLDATLQYQFKPIGGVQAVHFAGHGEVDPARPGNAALYLNNGKAINPKMFIGSALGANFAPFLFLNACMVGVGGELLGGYGGFPGGCLSGGFSALVAPLWAVNDEVAKEFALEFYRQALTVTGGRLIPDVLRDLRAKYDHANPVTSYLAYVYYGSPFLTLTV